MSANRQLLPLGLYFFAVVLSTTTEAWAKAYPAPIFQPHMVLQQQMPIRIWGTADAGEGVAVRLGDTSRRTIADRSGHWQVTFPPREASTQAIVLSVNDLALEDILIGEVWLCSGQSNMVRNLQQVQPDILPYADIPFLRVLNVHHDGVPLVSKNGFTDEMLARCNTEDFFRGQWQVSTVQTAGAFSAVAWYFGRELWQGKHIPVGIIKVAVGGSAINNWIAPDMLKADPDHAEWFTQDWFSNPDIDRGHRQRGRDALQHATKDGEPWLPGRMRYRWMCEPGFLFEAGIAPLKPLSFRGVLWYQGETDAITEASTQRYASLFPMLIRNWRAHFGREDLPFLFVQLPGYGKDTWPDFRQIQAKVAQRMDGVWMATAIDLGLKADVHPTDKEPVGHRLYLLAREHVYGNRQKSIFPTVKHIKTANGKTEIILDSGIADLIPVRGNVPGFEVCGGDGRFMTVPAAMKERDAIVLTHQLDTLISVRYGWQPFPEPPLSIRNGQQLPMAPFTHTF